MTTDWEQHQPHRCASGLSSNVPRQHEVPVIGDRSLTRIALTEAGVPTADADQVVDALVDTAERVGPRQVSSSALLVFFARVGRSVLVVRRPLWANWRDPLREGGPNRRILPAGRRLGCPSSTAGTPALLPAVLMVDVAVVPASGSE